MPILALLLVDYSIAIPDNVVPSGGIPLNIAPENLPDIVPPGGPVLVQENIAIEKSNEGNASNIFLISSIFLGVLSVLMAVALLFYCKGMKDNV